jgi:hypothetical protein
VAEDAADCVRVAEDAAESGCKLRPRRSATGESNGEVPVEEGLILVEDGLAMKGMEVGIMSPANDFVKMPEAFASTDSSPSSFF